MAVVETRRYFQGPLTYASVPLEKVDWSCSDYAGLDYYREARTRSRYRETLERYLTFGKPIVITEFSCCAYQGAEERGARVWEVVDKTTNPPQVKGNLGRDENVQAKELIELLRIFDAVPVAGAFGNTFMTLAEYYNAKPAFDFDMANNGLVISYADRSGATYPGLPWEAKKAFYALANYFAGDLSTKGILRVGR